MRESNQVTHPNILVLISDQHSRYHLGCYGDTLVRTPHLDGLAREGMTFDAAYCAAPLCVPSRMSFMTGRRPSANRVWNNGHILSSAIPTWAHSLGAAGYETALVGRMHFVGPEQRHGFELRPVGEYSAVHPGAPRLGGPQFREIPRSTSGQNRGSVEIAGTGRTSYQAFDETIAAAACQYLTRKAGERGGRPFAAVAGFVLPHCPFVAPADLFDYYYQRVDVPQPSAAELAAEPAAVRRFKENRGIAEPLPEERIRVARAAYFGLCEYFDQQVGRVLQVLEETGLSENTLVVYCSDHGEMAGEHGMWWKSNYYEASVGVPLIARLPGTIAAGARSDSICNLMDLAPTFGELAGAEPLPHPDGHSLWPELQGQLNGTRPTCTFSEHGPTRNDAASRMIRRDRYKLYKHHDDTPPALFDLAVDPGECRDLGSSPEHAAVREDLLRTLYEDWDPDYVHRQSALQAADMAVLSAWGEAVRPPAPEALPVPDVEDFTPR